MTAKKVVGWKGRLGPPTPAFGQAFRKARRAMQLEQRQLAAKLGLSPRSLTRWEAGEVLPRDNVREDVIGWLTSVPPETASPPSAHSGSCSPPRRRRHPSPTPPAAEAEMTRVFLEHAILSAAEVHQLPPAALRAAVARVLDAIEKTRAPLATARVLIAGQVTATA